MDSRCGLTTWCMSMAQVTVYAVYRGLRVFPRPASRSCAYVASLLLVGIVVSLCYRGRRRFFWVLQNAVQMPSKRGHLRRNLPKVSTRRNKSRPCRWEQCLCELFAFRLEFWGVFHVAQGGRMDSFFAALYCTFWWNTPLCHMPRIEPR